MIYLNDVCNAAAATGRRLTDLQMCPRKLEDELIREKEKSTSSFSGIDESDFENLGSVEIKEAETRSTKRSSPRWPFHPSLPSRSRSSRRCPP